MVEWAMADTQVKDIAIIKLRKDKWALDFLEISNW